jgi:hypothetical protein
MATVPRPVKLHIPFNGEDRVLIRAGSPQQ